MIVVQLIVAVVLPPVAVFWRQGLDRQFWLNVVLTMLAFVPGVVHAVWVVVRRGPAPSATPEAPPPQTPSPAPPTAS